MDRGYIYGLPSTGQRVSLYVPLDPKGLRAVYEPPTGIVMANAETGEQVTFQLLDETLLDCGDVSDGNGTCKSWDCHRIRLGRCGCGRHQNAPGTPDDSRPVVRVRAAA